MYSALGCCTDKPDHGCVERLHPRGKMNFGKRLCNITHPTTSVSQYTPNPRPEQNRKYMYTLTSFDNNNNKYVLRPNESESWKNNDTNRVVWETKHGEMHHQRYLSSFIDVGEHPPLY